MSTTPNFSTLAVAAGLVLTACSSAHNRSGDAGVDAALPDDGASDVEEECFPCSGYWICGGDVTRIDLMTEIDGCHLTGLPGRNLLAPDGTITEDGAIVGRALGSGARVHVSYPDGSQWLLCAGGGGCVPVAAQGQPTNTTD